MRAFEKSYSIIFGRSAKKIAFYAAAALTILVLYKTFIHPTAPLYYLLFGAVLFTLFFVVDRSVVNPKRSFYVAVISTLIVALLDVVFNKPPLTFALVGGIISALVAQSLRCRSPAFALPLFFVSIIYMYMGNVALAVAASIYAAVIYGIKPLLKKIADGLDAMCMFSSFLYALFAEDDMIEDAFRELSQREKVPIHLYLIGGRHVVAVSEFHPGPFRHIGGGMLVDLLNDAVEKMGYRFVFLHGVGSHERDPISKDSVYKIVKAVSNALAYMQNGKRPVGLRPSVVEVGDVRVVSFSLGTAPHLAVVSRVKSASDDIPLWVARRVDPGAYVLVDAQNKFDGEVQWVEEDVKSLAEAIAKLHEVGKCTVFKIGVGKVETKRLDPLSFEIGPAGVSAIVTQCDRERGLLVVFDGNNLSGELYRKIIDRYGREFHVVEVVTTDTHRSTGVGFGRGYRIVGERLNHGDILKAVDKAVSMALENMDAHPVTYARVEVEAEVLGEEGFKKIKKVVNMYKRISALIIVAVFIIPAIVITTLA